MGDDGAKCPKRHATILTEGHAVERYATTTDGNDETKRYADATKRHGKPTQRIAQEHATKRHGKPTCGTAEGHASQGHGYAAEGHGKPTKGTTNGRAP